MSLQPSDLLVGFTNYAGRDDVDTELSKELEDAGITVIKMPEFHRKHSGEVQTIIIGEIPGSSWGFDRAWYYWIARGNGIPPLIAEELHKEFGTVVRVEGHCGCPSPLEYNKGFAVGLYHVDTPEGLKALADTIKKVMQ